MAFFRVLYICIYIYIYIYRNKQFANLKANYNIFKVGRVYSSWKYVTSCPGRVYSFLAANGLKSLKVFYRLPAHHYGWVAVSILFHITLLSKVAIGHYYYIYCFVCYCSSISGLFY